MFRFDLQTFQKKFDLHGFQDAFHFISNSNIVITFRRHHHNDNLFSCISATVKIITVHNVRDNFEQIFFGFPGWFEKKM